jgi:hypothetical protein
MMTNRYPDFNLKDRTWWLNGREGVWGDSIPILAIRRAREFSGTLTIRLDYPLNEAVTLTVEQPAGGWTWADFCFAVADAYERVYREQPTNVWGHEIGDLVLQGYAKKNRDGSWTPVIGS